MIYGGQFLWGKSCGWDKACRHLLDAMAAYVIAHWPYQIHLCTWFICNSVFLGLLTVDQSYHRPFLWTCKSGSVSYVSVEWSCINQFLSGWLNLSCSMGYFLQHDATSCVAHGAAMHTRQELIEIVPLWMEDNIRWNALSACQNCAYGLTMHNGEIYSGDGPSKMQNSDWKSLHY